MNMNAKNITSFLLCVVGFNLYAADFYFEGENQSGGGDLCTASNWRTGVVPKTGDVAIFNKSGELTSSGTFEVHTCKFYGGGLIWTLDEGKIKVQNTIYIGSNDNGGNIMTVEDGGCLQTDYDFYVGDNTSPNNKLIVKKGALINLASSLNSFRLASFGKDSYSNIIENYGSIVSTNSNYYYVRIGNAVSSSNNVFTCYEGSYFDTKGNLWVGYSGSNNKLIVKEGATFKQSNGNSRTITIGESASSTNNQFIVEKGAIVSSQADIHVGKDGSDNAVIHDGYNAMLDIMKIGINASAHRNKVVFTGDGEIVDLNLDNVSFGSGTNNEFRIEGKTVFLKAKTPTISPSTSGLTKLYLDKGCGNKIVAKDSNITSTGNFTSQKDGFSKGNAIEFDNTTWIHNNDASGNGKVSFENNATITVKNGSAANLANKSFIFGGSVTNAQNSLNLLNDSIMNVGYFRMSMSNNRIVISNSTLAVSSDTGVPYVNASKYVGINTNNVFRFEGETPSFTSAGSITFIADKTEDYEYGKTILEFQLPSAAYENAPIKAKSITVKRGNKLKVVLPEKEKRSDKVSYVIAEATTGVIALEDMEDFASLLPENCSVSLSGDGKKLVLRVRKNVGLKILIK